MNRSSQPCPLSEYTHQFKKYSAKRRDSLRPPPIVLTRDTKMECQTTNLQDFIPHPVTPPPPKTPAVYKPPVGKLDSTTEYKMTYEGKWAYPAKLVRPQGARREAKGPFGHKTTQAVDFVSFPIPPKEYHGQKSVYQPPVEPFSTKSTIQADFVDFGHVEPTLSLKPTQAAKISTDAFDGSTSYRCTFTPPLMPERFQRPKEVYKPSKTRFYGMTTFKDDFPAHPGVMPAQTMKPQPQPIVSEEPFEGTTISRLSYKSWELPARHSRPPAIFTPPTERFAAQTTFRSNYPDYGRVEPARSLRPKPRTRDQVAPFEALTTQSMDFKAWTDIERPLPIRRGKKYNPPSGKFDAMSTFQAHYKGEFIPRAPSAKPFQVANPHASKMESSTVYRDSFSAQSGYRPCPAVYLSDGNKSPSKYVYSHHDSTSGHKFFSPVHDMERQRYTSPITV